MGAILYFLLVSLSFMSWGHVLVLEYEDSDDKGYHGEAVSHIACKDQKLNCELLYEKVFDDDFVKAIEPLMKDVRVLNMSFGFQMPDLVAPGPPRRGRRQHAAVDYEVDLADFEEQELNLQNLMNSNPQTLFTIAAGNGYYIGNIAVLASPNGPLFPSYPSAIEAQNKVSVAAIRENKLAYYSNFSLFHVELAAPVENDHEGELIKGTSFAAPYVARLAGRILGRFPGLKISDLIEILIKSSEVKNLNLALKVTKDHLRFGEDSLVHKIHVEENYEKREQMRTALGDVLLVKSGGVVHDQSAMLCAQTFMNSQKALSVEGACLHAQKNVLKVNQDDLLKLKELWSLRGL